MSTTPNPKTITIPSDASRLPMTLPRIVDQYHRGAPLVMVTAYDYPSARAAEAAGVDLVLVGDSGAMTVLGYDSTVPVSLDELLILAKAVRRGLRTPLLVGDMTFGSYEVSDEHAVRNALRFVKEAGCDAVKLEGGVRMAETVAFLSERGVPVMGHIGLTPQSINTLGSFRAQGRDGRRHRFPRPRAGAGPERLARASGHRGQSRRRGHHLGRCGRGEVAT